MLPVITVRSPIGAIMPATSRKGWQTVVMDNLGFGKVLLVEDDEKLSGLIAHFLSQHGFEVRQVHRGDLALAAFLEFKPKVVVLDLMLPGQSGLHVCREIRSVSDTPIVILTAKEDDLDHILGLESGADDYVIKPIKPPVLLARLRALQRRQTPDSGVCTALEFGHLSIDRSCREVRLAGEGIELTTMEFDCLLYTSPSPRDRQKSRMPSSA